MTSRVSRMLCELFFFLAVALQSVFSPFSKSSNLDPHIARKKKKNPKKQQQKKKNTQNHTHKKTLFHISCTLIHTHVYENIFTQRNLISHFSFRLAVCYPQLSLLTVTLQASLLLTSSVILKVIPYQGQPIQYYYIHFGPKACITDCLLGDYMTFISVCIPCLQ